jgi:DNA repair protein RecO (recombination protein O)
MINGVRKQKARISLAHLQPLSLLNLEAYEKAHTGIQRIKELKNQPILLNLYQDFQKRSVAMFMIELLNTCLQAEDCEYELFDFLESEILKLENESKLAEFPIRFMLRLSKELGIAPQMDFTNNAAYLDLETGSFQQIGGKNLAEKDVSEYIYKLSTGSDQLVNVDSGLRKRTLSALILYYKYHLMPHKNMVSVDILSEIMDSWHRV